MITNENGFDKIIEGKSSHTRRFNKCIAKILTKGKKIKEIWTKQ